MNSIKYKDLITELLLQDERLWNEGKTEFNQVLLFDLLDKVDEKIIDLLLQNEEIRNKFFIKIKDVYVFKSNDFKFFMVDCQHLLGQLFLGQNCLVFNRTKIS